MKKNVHFFVFFIVLIITNSLTASAQNRTYFTEYFDDGATAITGTTANAATTPTTATIKTGVWTTYYSFRAGSGCTPQDPVVTSAKVLRVLGTTATTPAGLSTNTNGPNAYLITPTLNFGVDTVYWKNFSNSTTGTISIYYSTNNGTSWTLAQTVTSTGTSCDNYFIKLNLASANKIKFQAESSTSADLDNITITSVNTILPVKFGALNASLSNGLAKISWDVISEINTASYSIERSEDGKSFASVGSLTATNAPKYSFVDNTPASGVGYYRIKAVDKDGTVGYSNVIKLSNKKVDVSIAVTPNPVVNGMLNLQLNNFSKAVYSVALYDFTGKQVFTKSLNIENGTSSQSVELPSSVAKGVYQLQVTNGNIKLNKSVLIQ